jgi:putative ABC transport system permease protein
VVAGTGDVTPDELAVRLQTELTGAGVEVLTGEADTATKQSELRDNLAFFNSFLLAFALISLFVGMFIIYNTFSIVIAQRTRDLALLRAIGAGRGQVVRSVVLEAVAVAVVAVAAGLGLGVGMSFALRGLLSRVGLEIPSGEIVVSSATVVTAVVVGVVVTLVSALAPALRAGRVPPIAALRDVAIDRSHLSLKRTLIGLAGTGLGVVLMAAGISGSGSPRSPPSHSVPSSSCSECSCSGR